MIYDHWLLSGPGGPYDVDPPIDEDQLLLEAAEMDNMRHPNAELIDGLEELAAWLRARPTLKSMCTGQTFYIFAGSKEDFLQMLPMMGTATKQISSTEAYLDIVKRFPGDVEVKLCAARELVCTRVKIGERIVPAEPEKVVPAIPERVVEEFRWECPPSMLAEAREPANA